MRRAIAIALVFAIPAALGACASAPRTLPPGYELSDSGSPYRVASYHTTSDLPSRAAPRPSTPAPRPTTTVAAAPKALAASPASHTPAPTYGGRMVRLRGSPEIHVAGCPKVVRAHRDGVLPASAGDGPPCFTCRRSEAIGRSTSASVRSAAPRAPAAPPRAAASRPAPTYSGHLVRLRGSPEIHVAGCPKVMRAHADGVLSASAGDGPPCFTCRKNDAIAWSR